MALRGGCAPGIPGDNRRGLAFELLREQRINSLETSGGTAMTTQVSELKQKKCVPCEGGVPQVPRDEAKKLVGQLAGWELTDDGKRIRRKWTVKNFMAGLDFFQRVGDLAEKEGHHPDLHLEGYRNATIELWTHAIGGLSENDFILAAKINDLPVELKK
jgi:4a-hydroxytetrahydrobiopterin dehydratase